MIVFIRGKIVRTSAPNSKKGCFIVVENQGMGYELYIAKRFLTRFKVGEQYEIHAYQHVWEKGEELFGFPALKDLDFFKQLIDLPGIGPKTALNILDHVQMEDVQKAIVQNEPKLLCQKNGLGRKTAEKLVSGLKDLEIFSASLSENSQSNDLEVAEALSGLGFGQDQIRTALSFLPSDCQTSEEKIKYALRKLGKR